MGNHLEQEVEPPTQGWDFLDEETKERIRDSNFDLLARLAQKCLDVDKFARKVDYLERKITEIEYNYKQVNKFGPSAERDACMAISLEKWKEAVGFYISLKSPDAETLSFLRQMALRCEEGWPMTPTLLQAQWALSLIDSFDNWQANQAKAEQGSLAKNIVKQWKKYITRIKSKKKAQDVACRIPMDVLEDIKRRDEDTGYAG